MHAWNDVQQYEVYLPRQVGGEVYVTDLMATAVSTAAIFLRSSSGSLS
jgi:hypothetical protein